MLPLVYEELRKLAAHKMAQEKPGHTLQATALVHEAWLRLAGSDRQQWRGREHFISAAAEAMRRILVESARRKLRLRHGGGQQRVEMDCIDLPIAADDEKCLAVHEYLEQLANEDPEKAEVVKLPERQPFRPFSVRLVNGARYTFKKAREFGAPKDYHIIFFFGESEAVRIDTDSIVKVIER